MRETMANFRGRKVSEPYQELEESRGAELNNAAPSSPGINSCDYNVDRSMELASIAVIPDGKQHTYTFILIATKL